jgi:hypothetical protein
MISLNTSKKLFSEIPEKQAIAFKGQYSDRRCETILEITPTSGDLALPFLLHVSAMYLEFWQRFNWL